MPTQPHIRDWIDIATAMGPLLAVVVAVGVAIMQSYLQRQQLKQDLFAKRYAVYEGVKAYIVHIMRTAGKTEIPSFQQFWKATDGAEFLFGSDVVEYIRRIGHMGLDYRATELQFEYDSRVLNNPNLNPDEHDKRRWEQAADRHQGLIDQGAQYFTEADHELRIGLNDKFRPYLNLYDGRLWHERVMDAMDVWEQQRDARFRSRYRTD